MDENHGLKARAAKLPDLPGVYLMKDVQGNIIYCGKALSLRKRVASYFRHAPDHDPRKGMLCSQVRDIEYIVTSSELEALILESNLIKKHKPRFNILLRDDKNYPHLCFTLNEPFPRLKVVRRVKKDKCLYFGPFIPSKALRQTLHLIHKIFPVRKCSAFLSGIKKRPCLNHQIGLCCAPCAGLITQAEYKDLIEGIILFLQGKRDDLEKMLKKEMEQAASQQRYEQAARLRDQIQAIQSCVEKQAVFSHTLEDQDYFAFARQADRACVQVFFVRFGRMTGAKSLHISAVRDVPEKELMANILEQFYWTDKFIPSKILVQVMPEEALLIERWLSGKRGAKVKIRVPQRGDKKKLMLMAGKNAALGLASPPVNESMSCDGILEQVKNDLRLPDLPRRIEGFDISNLGPSEAVGSMVSWQDAMPVKSEYRRFKIKGIKGIDDYGMMAEVIRRRYKRIQAENERMPDLILIDGGKGHLQAGLNALAELGIKGVCVASLAKREEQIFLPGMDSPLGLPRRSPTLQLMQRIRDEAHRFALTYQRARRTKIVFSSALDNIPGVGPKRKKELLKHFQGMDNIKKASLEDLLSVKGVDRTTANNIFDLFHK